jgi:hypothetical protein
MSHRKTADNTPVASSEGRVNRLNFNALACSLLSCSALLAAAAPASASSLSMIRTGTGKAAFIHIAVDGINRGVVAGEFQWNWDPETPAVYDDTFYSYGIDARNSLVNHDTVAIRSTDLLMVAGVPDAGGKGAWLFNAYGPGIRTAVNERESRDQAAALQVAIWEAMLDTSNDLTTGAMKIVSNSDIKEKVKNYLLALYNPDGSYKTSEATWLDLSTSQNQLALPGVPEPGTLLMLGSGIGLAVAIRRRRQGA